MATEVYQSTHTGEDIDNAVSAVPIHSEQIANVEDGVKNVEKRIKLVEDKINSTVIDTEMSDSSENPVQNKVVKQYVDDNVEDIHNTYGWMGDAIGNLRMTDENLSNVLYNRAEFRENKGVPNGYAPLDKYGKIPDEYLYGTAFTTYGVSVDLSNSNPETSVTYSDDAVGMNGGSPAWYKMSIFNKIRPCLFKNGAVVGYLNPDNFAQFEDGSAADITSGDSGDVMIEIPKIGYKISKNGTTLTVHITDDPDKAGFSYKAHTRKIEGDRDKLYVGAFLGSKVSSNLCSLSGKTPHSNERIDVFGGYANAKGLGYDVLSFYPLMLLQCLYVIMYKNLNSQAALGMGYVSGTDVKITGATVDKGMNYGSSDGTEQMKFLGMEDFWGNLNQLIYGCYVNGNSHVLTATDSFNATGNGYTDMGEISPYSIGGYMSEPQGNNDLGFMICESRGSSSTYFSDYVMHGLNLIPTFGGCYVHGDAAGVFRINMIAPGNSAIYFGARLMYL